MWPLLSYKERKRMIAPRKLGNNGAIIPRRLCCFSATKGFALPQEYLLRNSSQVIRAAEQTTARGRPDLACGRSALPKMRLAEFPD